MQEQYRDRRFSGDEIGELIELATRLDQKNALREQGISFQELHQIAMELGISDQALLEAVAKRIAGERSTAELAGALAKQTSRWEKALTALKIHTGTYLASLLGLTVIDVASGDGVDWVFYPAAGWGMGLLIHAVVTMVNRPRTTTPTNMP